MDPLLGMIFLFAGNFAPTGYLLCSGQLLAISQNAALFSIIGTYYGGNGTTNFALPDFRGRVPISQGQGPGLSPYNMGQVGGTENTTLLLSNLPIHTHPIGALSVTVSASTVAATASVPSAGTSTLGV